MERQHIWTNNHQCRLACSFFLHVTNLGVEWLMYLLFEPLDTLSHRPSERQSSKIEFILRNYLWFIYQKIVGDTYLSIWHGVYVRWGSHNPRNHVSIPHSWCLNSALGINADKAHDNLTSPFCFPIFCWYSTTIANKTPEITQRELTSPTIPISNLPFPLWLAKRSLHSPEIITLHSPQRTPRPLPLKPTCWNDLLATWYNRGLIGPFSSSFSQLSRLLLSDPNYIVSIVAMGLKICWTAALRLCFYSTHTHRVTLFFLFFFKKENVPLVCFILICALRYQGGI